jgi:hypothetical protein
MCQGRQERERERMDRSLVNVVGRYSTTVYGVPNSAITGVYSAQTRRRCTLTVTRCVNAGRLRCFFFPLVSRLCHSCLALFRLFCDANATFIILFG